MQTSPNIRSKCTGSVVYSPIILNGCFDFGYFKSGSKVSESINVTKVMDWHTGSLYNPQGISPYARSNGDPADCCVLTTPAACCSGNPCCGVPSPTDTITCSISNSTIYNGTYYNCFNKITTSIDTRCPPSFQYGHKQIYLSKKWHGVFGPTSPYWMEPDHLTWCCNCQYLSPQTSSGQIDQTKYLKLSGSSQIITNTVAATYTETAANIVEVSRYSGQLIVDLATSSSNNPSDPQALAPWQLLTSAANVNGNINANNMLTYYCSAVQSDIVALGAPTVVTNTGANSYHVEWDTTICGGNVILKTYDITPTSLVITQYGHDNSDVPCSWRVMDTSTWVFSTAGYSYTNMTHVTGALITQYTDTTQSITVSYMGSYQSGDVQKDMWTAFSSSSWDIDNNTMYPYRPDTSPVAPWVHFDEDTNWTPTLGYTSSSIAQSGLVLGKPLPSGYNHWWDSTHQNWVTCNLTDPPCGCDMTVWTNPSVGAYSDDPLWGCFVPSATSWVDAFTAQTLAGGCAWVGMNFRQTIPDSCDGTSNPILDDIIWASIFRETKVPRPSLSFARPCGEDRFNTVSSSCINYMIGNEVVTTGTSIQTGQQCLVCGTSQLGPSYDGVWSVTAVGDGYGLTLSNLLISGSQVQNQQTCSFGPTIGVLQWTNAPALCGRAYVTSTSHGTCSLDRSTALVDNDQVMTVSGGLQTVKVFDPSHIYIPNSGSVQYIYSPSAADWRWDDNQSKGSYYIANVQYQNRLNGEYVRLNAQAAYLAGITACDGVSPCSAGPTIPQPAAYLAQCTNSCVAVTPCSAPEMYSHINISGSYIMDSLYGTLLMIDCVQSEADPYWYPPSNCNSTNPFVEDNGTCTGTYAARPYVEDMCTSPPGAPVPLLPWGFINYSPLNPGQFHIDPYLLATQAQCVCSDGTFAIEYLNDGVNCVNT